MFTRMSDRPCLIIKDEQFQMIDMEDETYSDFESFSQVFNGFCFGSVFLQIKLFLDF